MQLQVLQVLELGQVLLVRKEMNAITGHIDGAEGLQVMNLNQVSSNDPIVLQVECNKALAWTQIFEYTL